MERASKSIPYILSKLKFLCKGSTSVPIQLPNIVTFGITEYNTFFVAGFLNSSGITEYNTFSNQLLLANCPLLKASVGYKFLCCITCSKNVGEGCQKPASKNSDTLSH